MIIIKSYWIRSKVFLMGSVLMLRLLRNWRKSPEIIKLGELGSHMLGKTLLHCDGIAPVFDFLLLQTLLLW